MKHSSVLGQFLSYEENKVLWIRPQTFYNFCPVNCFPLKIPFWSIIFCLLYEAPQRAGFKPTVMASLVGYCTKCVTARLGFKIILSYISQWKRALWFSSNKSIPRAALKSKKKISEEKMERQSNGVKTF